MMCVYYVCVCIYVCVYIHICICRYVCMYIANALKKELSRQQDQLESIASENIVSRAVLEAQVCFNDVCVLCVYILYIYTYIYSRYHIYMYIYIYIYI